MKKGFEDIKNSKLFFLGRSFLSLTALTLRSLKPRVLTWCMGFTLIELIIVIVIIGVLATLGVSQYYPLRERALDKEAEANLRLIASAERIYRMETQTYVTSNTTSQINSDLRLSITTTRPSWSYFVHGNATNFCAQANRTSGTARFWTITSPSTGTPDPRPQSSVFDSASACP